MEQAVKTMTIGEYRDAIIRQYGERPRAPSQGMMKLVRRVFLILETFAGVKTAAEVDRRDILGRFDEALPRQFRPGW
jgi:hypothetical protein